MRKLNLNLFTQVKNFPAKRKIYSKIADRILYYIRTHGSRNSSLLTSVSGTRICWDCSPSSTVDLSFAPFSSSSSVSEKLGSSVESKSKLTCFSFELCSNCRSKVVVLLILLSSSISVQSALIRLCSSLGKLNFVPNIALLTSIILKGSWNKSFRARIKVRVGRRKKREKKRQNNAKKVNIGQKKNKARERVSHGFTLFMID